MLGSGDRGRDWRSSPSCWDEVSTSVSAHAGDGLYASLGDTTRAPIGWVEFCAENPGDAAAARRSRATS